MSTFWISIISGAKALAISAITYGATMQATGLDPLGADWKTLVIGALATAFVKGSEKSITVRRSR